MFAVTMRDKYGKKTVKNYPWMMKLAEVVMDDVAMIINGFLQSSNKAP